MSATTDKVLVGVSDGIAVLTLNDPASRNTLSEGGMIEALTTCLVAINGRDDIRCAVLTGAGSSFCAGGDLKRMAAPGGLLHAAAPEIRQHYVRGIQQLPLTFQRLEVPVIAAVNGPAIGAGCDLACMCDLRIAATGASFAESFVKIGAIPGDGGAWLLPRLVGLAKALELALTGDAISAEDALACGLVTKVVPEPALMLEALALARRIAANPRHAVRMTKRLLADSLATRLETHLDMAAAMQAVAQKTDDHREAVLAFVEKRAPRFTGT